MNKIIIVILISILSLSTLRAQVTADHYWHEGSVTTIDDKVLSGKVKYSLKHSSLTLDQGITKTTYTPRTLKAFSFFDQKENKQRDFLSLPLKNQKQFEVPTFFEVLHNGITLSLLLIEKETIVQSIGGPYSRHTTRIEVVYQYYFLYPDATIQPFDGTKKTLYQIFKDFKKDLKSYIKKEKLSLKSKEDMTKIITYINRLMS